MLSVRVSFCPPFPSIVPQQQASTLRSHTAGVDAFKYPPQPLPTYRWKFETESLCYQGTHGILTWVLGIPGLILIAQLCPVVTACFLARNKHRLHTPEFLVGLGAGE